MLKKVVLLFCLLIIASSAQALVGIGVLGSSYNTAGTTVYGYGIDIEMPIIPLPLLKSRIEVSYVNQSTYTLMPILLTGTYGIPMTPIYVGIGGGAVIYNQSGATVPTAINYNAFVGYEKQVFPMSSWFIQAGYEVMKINYTVAGVSFNQDFSGASIKTGLHFGI